MKKYSDLLFIMAIWCAILIFMVGCNSGNAISQASKSEVKEKQKSIQPAPRKVIEKSAQPDKPVVKPPVIENVNQGTPKRVPSKFAESESTYHIYMPKFDLTQQHKKTCRVLPGDMLPAFQVTDLDKQSKTIQSLFGEKYSVILFWHSDYRYSEEAVSDLETLIQMPFQSQGVRVLAINVGDSAENIEKTAEKYGINFPMLLDKEAAAWKQVTQGTDVAMPRIYLVDAAGKIIWMDLEYSRTTRRDLTLTILYQMQKATGLSSLPQKPANR